MTLPNNPDIIIKWISLTVIEYWKHYSGTGISPDDYDSNDLFTVLKIYHDISEYICDSENLEWDEIFSSVGNDYHWTGVMDSFVKDVVLGKFDPEQDNLGIDITKWSYYQPTFRVAIDFKYFAEVIEEKDEDDDNKEDEAFFDSITPVDICKDNVDIIKATLDMAEADARSQLFVNLEAYCQNVEITTQGASEVLVDSIYYEIIRATIALTGKYTYECSGLNTEPVEFTNFDDVKGFVVQDLAIYQRKYIK